MSISKLFAGIVVVAALLCAPAQAQSKLAVFNSVDRQSVRTVDHSMWGEFLNKYLSETPDGRTVLAYGDVSEADHEKLKKYLGALQAEDPTSLNADEAFSYWVNFYNALTIDVVLDEYPVKSILRIFSGLQPGPWKKRLAIVNGVRISLDNIEHGILREFWKDNRVHYAVNCASYGCPNLAAQPFTSENLEQMLNEGAIAYVNHPRAVQIENGKLTVSSIYKWFKEDFGENDAQVIAHLQEYAAPPLREQLEQISKINDYKYDWSLNEASASAAEQASAETVGN